MDKELEHITECYKKAIQYLRSITIPDTLRNENTEVKELFLYHLILHTTHKLDMKITSIFGVLESVKCEVHRFVCKIKELGLEEETNYVR